MPITRHIISAALYLTAVLLAGGPVAPQSSPSNTCQPFPSNTLYLEDENPNIGLGDFNSDGILDIVALTPQGVNVLLGKGGGTIRIAGTFPAGKLSAYSQITVGDFNRDGKLDAALADEGQAGGAARRWRRHVSDAREFSDSVLYRFSGHR